MNFNEVYNRIEKKCMPINIRYILHSRPFYHVIIDKSALLTFDKNLVYHGISQLCNNEHVHLIVSSPRQKVVKNNPGIKSEQIKSKSKLFFIYEHFFNFLEKEQIFFAILHLPFLHSNICVLHQLLKI